MKLTPGALAVLVIAFIAPARADEGMWLFSAPPREKLQAAYGFQLDDAWLNHLMKASVRFNNGGSGSFVSGDGLVITNHHVGLDSLQKMSDASHNYPRDGFYAATAADEVKCLDLELNVLESTEDVTNRVNAAVPASALGDDAAAARRKVFAEIEKESHDKTGLRSDVVTLYQGGAYHLYRYKRYTDIRLVFAPEQQAAFFGGDPDNFEYPRYDLDICIFRVYDNGQVVHPEHFLKWSVQGARDGDLVFVSGKPGRTERLFTVAELEFLRDTAYPQISGLLKRREVLEMAWSARSDENARRSRDDFFGIQNSRKAYDGLIAGLQTPSFMDAKQDAEDGLKHRFSAMPDGQGVLGAYRRIAEALRLAGISAPIWIRNTAETAVQGDNSFLSRLIEASFLTGSLLCDGVGDLVSIETESDPARAARLSYNVLQGAGARISKAEFVACPSCGRTLFDLQTTTQRIRTQTAHLKGVKIAIMGCIVNGPGEMADADFGYVGGAPGKINLYVGKQCVQYNIPQAEADARLIALIKEHKKWAEPEPAHA